MAPTNTLTMEPLDMANTNNTTPAQRLRLSYRAARLSFTWLGTRKTLDKQQKDRAAETFGAEGESISAGKKLLDTKHPAFRAVTEVRGNTLADWRSMSLPFPEPGIRLIRESDVSAFDSRMNGRRAELEIAVNALEYAFDELRDQARARLGELYNPADYPASLRGLFAIAWDFPNVEPPDYLRSLRPDLYEQEQRRIAARFDEAVAQAEEAFTDELSKMLGHLTERLSGADDGKPKIFRDSAIENLTEFFDRFKRLNVRSSAELDALVDRTRDLVANVSPKDLRTSATLRQQIASELSTVTAALDGMLVDRPRRRLMRGLTAAAENAAE